MKPASLPRNSSGANSHDSVGGTDGRPAHSPHAETASVAHTAQPFERIRLPRNIYPFRTLGMALAGLPAVFVLLENQAPVASWLWLLFFSVVWPHLAYLIAVRSARPFQAEVRNLIIDSLLAGTLAAQMHFNVLPAVLIISGVTSDKLSSGVRGLWWRSLPAAALGILLAGLFTGFAFQPITTMPVLLACLPLTVIHTLLVSIGTYRLLHTLRRQNRALAELSQLDTLTSLYNRRHWTVCANDLMRQCRAQNRDAVLMQLDVDNFKTFNDQFGHAVGDDILRHVADIIVAAAPSAAVNGRRGGDEFVLIMPASAAVGMRAAEQIRSEVERLSVVNPELPNCTVSIGLAYLDDTHEDLPQWLEAADQALYRSKRAGRNRIATPLPPAPSGTQRIA